MRVEKGKTLFFSEADSFSNWFRSDFEVKGVKFNCVEQFMMYCKAKVFKDEESATKILESKNPREQKKIGREVKGYDDEIWAERRVRIVTAGCLAKFRQNPFIRDELISTGNTALIEASPYDKVWGVGLRENDPHIFDESKWRGLNLLGKALTHVRDILKAELDLKGEYMNQYESWNDLTKTPEAHLEFLRVIDGHINQGLEGRELYQKLNKEVTVDGKPFSQAFHLTKLEANSGNWDTDETPDPVKLEIVSLTEKVKAADPGYDMSHFTTGYEYMIREMKERGVNVAAGLDHTDPEPKKVVSGSDYEPGI